MSEHDGKVRTWLSAPLPGDVKRAIERLASSSDVVRVAVMPDVHLSEDVCVGTCVATTHMLYPSAVGGDIGCGMAALKLDLKRDDVDHEDVALRLLADFERRIPILAHRADQALPDVILGGAGSAACADNGGVIDAGLLRDARRQLGTLGRGNHFLELQVEEGTDDVWLCVHCGSRGAGQTIRERALARCTPDDVGLLRLDAASMRSKPTSSGVQRASARSRIV